MLAVVHISQSITKALLDINFPIFRLTVHDKPMYNWLSTGCWWEGSLRGLTLAAMPSQSVSLRLFVLFTMCDSKCRLITSTFRLKHMHKAEPLLSLFLI